MTEPARLCLNMIVRNEAPIIRRCLESVADHIACWVIADTGSTDDTREIIEAVFRERNIPGKLHRFPFLNFEQARNEALNRARVSQFEFDYLLLTDADMELVVEDKEFRNGLSLAYYSVLQNAGITYWNVRLLNRHVAARYVGTTHEYIDIKGAGARRYGLHFKDYAEGSSRVEKSARDLRLLEADLKVNPANGRSWFYMGQTNRDMKRWQEAATAYQKRIDLGGWEEETWYTRLQMARCLLKAGDEGGFLREMLTAWSDRPHRAEPLFDLSVYHRNHGRHTASLLFAEAGLRLPYPKQDTLFIENWVYEYTLREEVVTSGFHVASHRARAAELCDGLALDPSLPKPRRDFARRNLRFFTPPLQQLLPGFAPQRMDFTPEPGWQAMNPSVARLGDALWMVQRTVNYRMTEEGDYLTGDGGPVRTRNFLLRLDEALATHECREILLPADLPPPAYTPVQGFEDLRPFAWNGQLWATATVRQLSDEGWCDTVLARIDMSGSEARLVEWRLVRPQRPRQHEKNWIIAAGDNGVRFIYSVAPTRVMDTDGRLLAQRKVPWAAEQMRGGSQAVGFADGWLALTHEHTAHGRRRHYYHRFAWFDRRGMLRRLSAPFVLQRPGVEFAAGLAWHPDGKRLVLSFGVGDAESWLGTIEAVSLPGLAWHDAAASAAPPP